MLSYRVTSHLMLRAVACALILGFGVSWAPSTSAQSDPVIAAAGDIACDPFHQEFNEGSGGALVCHMQATAALVIKSQPTAVLALGDLQYEDGDLLKFIDSYDKSWGRIKQITRPAVGNHEYGIAGARGYFAYFGPLAGARNKGYYSYDLGAWHLIALNSNCGRVGGCGEGSPQERWLRADLAAHAGACILAYWHHPRFSSGWHGSDQSYRAFWQALYQAGTALVLNGHDHDYERFARQDPDGRADPTRGIREFVVGTGGRSIYFFRTVQPNSEVRYAGGFGILVLTLHPGEYEWKFVSEEGKTFTDAGRGTCH